ncbi:MAG: family 78 glycoside hydrolase catalytic domain [Eubacteriales bacterium]|nr:family 78 glycoside hydrolase catalytic domain [Eubacteriales bacterium]
MKIYACKVNHLTNPIGYQMTRTVFSWKVRDAAGTTQKLARIRVAGDEAFEHMIYDTGYSEEPDSLATEMELKLRPMTRYYWDVSVISDRNEQASSDVNFFETSKMDLPWQAKWITCDSHNSRHPEFFKRIETEGKVRRARLYICGLGLYEAHIDNERIGNEYLTPYCNDYTSWLQYQTYDVTDMITDGRELRVLLGNGWYKGRFLFTSREHKGIYGDNWYLIAELHIEYEDGSVKIIGTDESWQIRRSRIVFSNIYDGEHRDDTLEISESEACAVTDGPEGRLTARLSTPVTVREEIKPTELIHTPAGEQVLDLGQNFAGSFRLRVDEPKGTKVHLHFGEILQGGNFYRENLRSALAEYIYISDGKPKELTPLFTFYGYRYVKIDGIRDLRREDFTGLALYSEFDPAGRVTTGSSKVDQLVSNTLWGLKSNFLDVPTDCPQRDERMGWTGDAQAFCTTACYLVEPYAFMAKYLTDMAYEQKADGGRVPYVVPSFKMKGASSVWGDAACVIPWTLYRFYGDKSILADQFGSMSSWVDFITRTDGDDHGWGTHFHFGDWLALDNEKGEKTAVMGGTDVGYIAYVYYMASADIVAGAAAILGRHDDEAKYRAVSENVRKYILHEYFSPRGRCCINTQTGHILALEFGLTADREWTAGRLEEMIHNSKDKLLTGFVGTPLALLILSGTNRDSLAYDLLLNEEYPGWLYAVNMGATTIWERWNSVLEDGSISDTGMNSLNHYAYGSVTRWIFEYAGGIRQDEDSVGFRSVLLAPVPDRRIGHAEAAYDSPAGLYECSWKILDGKRLRVSGTVPFGGRAKLILPGLKDGNVHELGAGDFVFEYVCECWCESESEESAS